MASLLRKRHQLVVAVCTANITRSPYFAMRLRKELESLGDRSLRLPTITSAGVRAAPGYQAHPVLQQAARMRGNSLSEHRSRPFDDAVANEAELVLTFEQWQAEELRIQYPELAERIYPLLAYGRDEGDIPEQLDIPDPTGGEMEDYQRFMDIADAQAQRLRRYFKKTGRFPV